MTTIKTKATDILEKAKSLFGKQVQALAGQESKVRELLSNVGRKIAKFGEHPKVKMLIDPVSIFIRMVMAHFSGTHKLSGSTLGLLLLALVYFLSPVDFIPDFLGFMGFADDVSVVLAVYAKLKNEVEKFLDWEKSKVQS
ncbi:MAG: YkvA family protein [Algoriphagus sp.]|nr:YkvA family protein [Algoriphagus sp.]